MNEMKKPQEMNKAQAKSKSKKAWAIIFLLVLVWLFLYIFNREIADAALVVSLDYVKEMVLILPPVFLLMGLIEVWLPKENITKWLGDKSGLKGAGLSVLLGTLPAGPLYVAFPMVYTFIKKGASITNIILFMGSWAALKIPQIMIEVNFLGWEFALLRFGLTILFLFLIGKIMEKFRVQESIPKQLN